MKNPWNRRDQKARDSERWLVSLCALSHLLLTRSLCTHEIDDRLAYDHKTGERLAPHLVKIGRRTGCEATIRHQLFGRVPISLVRGKKVRCPWLEEMKEGAD